MSTHEAKKFMGELVTLDGNEFINCEFENCTMVYNGGEQPKLQQCHFARCQWKLDQAAKRTMIFLRSIYHSGPGGRELVEETLKSIRAS
jgi:hypothetical protein